jgi:choline monooxygenase
MSSSRTSPSLAAAASASDAVDRIAEFVACAAQSQEELATAVTLPRELFNDPAWFAAEQSRLLHRGWIAVTRSAALNEPGQFVAVSIGDEPVAVIRGRDGVLRAMSNVCRHRSMTILEGAGSTSSVQCQYHLWTYRHDGTLVHAPSMDQAAGFVAAEVCLPQFAVDEWQGWVLVNIDANATPLSQSCPTLDALLTEHRVGEMVSVGSMEYPSPWNWKISIENFLESYHHRGVHPETLEPTYPGAKSFASDSGPELWTGIDHVSVVEGIDPFVAIVAYPTLMFAIVRGVGMTWFHLSPLSVDATHLRIEVLVLPEFADQPEICQLLLQSTKAVNEEDIPVNRRTAAGLRSKFSEPGRISHLEEATWNFRRWLLNEISGSY